MSDRFQVLLAYDGTDFHGSQFQTGAANSPGRSGKRINKNWLADKSVLFAGRTDAGVHAAGQVIAFDFKWDHTEKELNQALNSVLPQDICGSKGPQDTE